MITSKVVAGLLAAFAILVAACTVLMAFQLLFAALDDAAAAAALRWIGFGCLTLLIVDVLLLVGAIAVRDLDGRRGDSDEP